MTYEYTHTITCYIILGHRILLQQILDLLAGVENCTTLCCAVLCCAVLCCAVLSCAVLCHHNILYYNMMYYNLLHNSRVY